MGALLLLIPMGEGLVEKLRNPNLNDTSLPKGTLPRYRIYLRRICCERLACILHMTDSRLFRCREPYKGNIVLNFLVRAPMGNQHKLCCSLMDRMSFFVGHVMVVSHLLNCLFAYMSKPPLEHFAGEPCL